MGRADGKLAVHAKLAAKEKLAAVKHAVEPQAKVVKLSLCSVSFLVLAVKTVALVMFYYIFSIGLTFYNKKVVKNFQLPLSFTMAHLVVKFILAGLVRCVIDCRAKEPRVTVSWPLYFKRIAPAGMASALDIGLSNWSFEFITISLYTMTKSTAVIFILVFALILRLEKWRWSLIFVVLFISSGLFLFTYHSTQFNLEGFIMVLSASVLSGMRWTLAQIVTQKSEIGLQNPIDMMYHIQPWMIITLLPLAATIEGVPLATTDSFFRFSEYSVLFGNLGLVLMGAVLAFMLEFSEFLLVCQTSSLTLSIAGIFKEVCTLYLAAKVNGDRMNLVNGVGLVVALSGIALHVILKAIHSRESALNGNIHHIEQVEMLTKEGSANDSDSSEDEIFNASVDR